METCSPGFGPAAASSALSFFLFHFKFQTPPCAPTISNFQSFLLTQFKFIFTSPHFSLSPQLRIIAFLLLFFIQTLIIRYSVFASFHLFCFCCSFSVFMKLSSSNSTRSTAAASFYDANIYCDGSGAAAGCIFSVLRRMLCSGSLPTHPSDHSSVAEERVSVCGRKEKRAVESSPGIVARLMGLDSMPERITRSRSLNSVDQIKAEGDEDGGIRLQGKKLHRRSKTSVSFRERPEFLELEDDEFIVLRFDDGDEKRSPGSSSELKQGRAKPRRNREEKDGERKQRKACEADAQARSIRTILQPAEPESDYMEAKSRRKQKQTSLAKKKKKEVASESDSEESSPVSIFDFYQPKTGQEAEQETETLVSADDDSWTRSSSSNSSRQSSPEPEPDKTKISENDQKAEAEHQQQHALLSKTVAAVNGQKKNRKAWDRACSVAVAEISSAEWGVKDVGDAAAELQVHIMDQLFNDLITDLLHSSI